MAYETGSATNVDTLLQALATFAAAQGWTINYNGNRTGTGAGLGTAIILSKAGQCHTTFRTHTANRWIETVGHDPYSSFLTTELQNNSSGVTRSNEVNGPFQAYHFFAGDIYLYVVVETTAGVYKHSGCGIIQQLGDASPGHFVYGTTWNMTGATQYYISDPNNNRHAVPLDNNDSSAGIRSTYLRSDYDGNSNYWSTTSNRLSFYPRQRDSRLSAVSRYTQRAVLSAPVFCLNRPNSLISFVGVAPNLRTVLLDWISPGDNLTLGSDVWKVFPIIRRNGAVTEPNSGVYGYAYKT